ncbi:DUF6879 family protein [Streptomyces sp. NPDC056716]|uniref:DUF6879 family protein n=1 Tax=unclassified Streptomyces TaxID=2593676 RepID=UPI0036B8D625
MSAEPGCLIEPRSVAYSRTGFRRSGVPGSLSRSEQAVAGLADHDFWLFDDRDVYRMHYTEAGAFVGGELLPPDRLTEYQGYRDRALTAAVPFAAYWERHR